MLRLILIKTYMLLLGNSKRTKRFFIFIFLGILMLIRIIWKPIEYLVILILFLILYKLIAKYLSKTVDDKLYDIKNLMHLQKYEKALEKIDEILTEELINIDEDKEKSAYEKCIFNKAACLQNLIYEHGNIEQMKQCVRLYEKALRLALEENKPVVNIMSRIGLVYYYLGLFQKDGEILKIAANVLESSLKEEEENRKYLITSIHINLGYCYYELANYFNREEYLKKSLEELDYAFDETSKENNAYNKAVKTSIMIYRASTLRKLNELNFNENYKMKAINHLNNAMEYSINSNNKHYKKYFITQYIVYNFEIAVVCFEMFKISNSEEYLKKCKVAITEVKECCAKKNNALIIRKLDEISAELEK